MNKATSEQSNYILNIDSSTTMCSIALAKGEQLIAVKELDGAYTHAENLTLFIQEILKESGVTINQLSAVAVSKGPGSYTGLRIGVSAAKGICYALNIPLIAINTLTALANEARKYIKESDAILCPMIDARRMEVYAALYDLQLDELRETQADIITEESYQSFIAPQKPFYIFGNGAQKCVDTFSSFDNVQFLPDIVTSASNLVSLSNCAFNNKQFEDVAYFEPFYLKDFIAKKAAI